MDNEFTEFLNQNWNDKFKAGVTSSSIHLPNNNNNNNNSNASNNNALNHHITLEQYQQHHSQHRGQQNFENLRLSFMQHRHQTVTAQQNATTTSATTNSVIALPNQQRNPSTTATCPKLIDISSIKGNASLPFDCQSKFVLLSILCVFFLPSIHSFRPFLKQLSNCLDFYHSIYIYISLFFGFL